MFYRKCDRWYKSLLKQGVVLASFMLKEGVVLARRKKVKFDLVTLPVYMIEEVGRVIGR